MISYPDAVRHLLWLRHEGRSLKWDSNNIRAILAQLGHREQSFPSVHIAGTSCNSVPDNSSYRQ